MDDAVQRLTRIGDLLDGHVWPEMVDEIRSIAARVQELEALRVDSMATRLQEVADRVGCPLGVDIIDWTADRIFDLEAGRRVEQEMLRNAAARIQELEAAMRRIVASGAYPEAAIAAEALGEDS